MTICPYECTDPPLTTIRQPIEAMGRAAVKLLSSQIDGTMTNGERLLFVVVVDLAHGPSAGTRLGCTTG